MRGSKLVDGPLVSCGCWRVDPDVRQTASTTMNGSGAHGESLRRHCRPPGRISYKFLDKYFREAKPNQVVAILKAREPARILMAIGGKDNN